ncbi:MAG: hypothetical protein FWE61_00415 [Micrococcales bacterium]|nr:hypothetical protein [Micrococcales bacterium]
MLQGTEPTGSAAPDTSVEYDLGLACDDHDSSGQPRYGGIVLAGLSSMAPGPELVAVLDGVDMGQLGDADLVAVLAAAERVASWAYETSARASAHIADRVARASCRAGRKDTGSGRHSAAAQEVALATGWSRASAARVVSQGRALAEVVPQVAVELRAGR